MVLQHATGCESISIHRGTIENARIIAYLTEIGPTNQTCASVPYVWLIIYYLSRKLNKSNTGVLYHIHCKINVVPSHYLICIWY